MDHLPIRCRCGQFQGRLASPERAGRALCYCRDCQAFARFLGEPDRVLDAEGGSDIVATQPGLLALTQGADQLRCMTLSPQGLLRWYTACCRTAVGNTPRDPKMAYVGLLRGCIAGTPAELDAAVGPARLKLNTASATRPVKPSSFATMAGAMLKIMRGVIGARLSGAWRATPFFRPGGAEPVVAPELVSREQRDALRGGA